MCCRTASTKPILPRKEMKTAIPPNGVTARCVSRRINRSSDNRALISRGTGLSVAFDSVPLLSQILASKITPNFGFSAYLPQALHRDRSGLGEIDQPGTADRRHHRHGRGMPIKVGNEVIEAVSVSGTPGWDKDEAC